ncbi:MAG: hypothetical protein QOH32_2447, partial [Bradyrhizobium sp.]|nr:hypothetical protein [Bradyrhizobium sp.]
TNLPATAAPPALAVPGPSPSPAPEKQDEAAKPEGAEVVRLDRFRKK